MDLSTDQQEALLLISKWVAHAPAPDYITEVKGGRKRVFTVGTSHDYPVCAVGGYAGTGKTTILREVADTQAKAVLVTPTHKAAGVLRGKLPGYMAGRVQTFHSLIYSPHTEFTCYSTGCAMELIDCGCADPESCPCDKKLTPCSYHEKYHKAVDDSLCDPTEELKFQKRDQLSGEHDLIIVDEASMLTEHEVNDLRSFGLPVLLVGDHGQLPPVKAKMNPWISNPSIVLTVNHRQGEESGIPEAAYEARSSGKLSSVSYGTSCRVLSARSPDAELLLDRFRPDARNSALLVQYNRTRAALNKLFHLKLSTGAKDHVLVPGERIISLDRQDEAQELDSDGNVVNETLIHNGTIATVVRVLSDGPRYCLIEAELDYDWRGRAGTHVLLKVARDQFGSPVQLGYRDKPHGAALWDYAYALTAHKAQGSEFDRVIVWQETPGDKRWIYTAVTRAREGLVVLT